MDWNRDDLTIRFAEEILRKHPLISYEHAVAAAEYSGVHRLPRDVFFAAIEKLGITRRDESEPAADSLAAEKPTSDLDARLIVELDNIRRQCTETTAMREALLKIRSAVQESLAEPE